MDETLPDGYRIEAAAVSASRRAAVVAAGYRGKWVSRRPRSRANGDQRRRRGAAARLPAGVLKLSSSTGTPRSAGFCYFLPSPKRALDLFGLFQRLGRHRQQDADISRAVTREVGVGDVQVTGGSVFEPDADEPGQEDDAPDMQHTIRDVPK